VVKLQKDIKKQEKLKEEKIDEVKADIERVRSTSKLIDMNLMRSQQKKRVLQQQVDAALKTIGVNTEESIKKDKATIRGLLDKFPEENKSDCNPLKSMTFDGSEIGSSVTASMLIRDESARRTKRMELLD